MAASRMTPVASLAAAFVAVTLFVVLALCGAADAHAASDTLDDAKTCCTSLDVAAMEAVDLAAGAWGKTLPPPANYARSFPASPHATPVLHAPPAVPTRSFYARSARILR